MIRAGTLRPATPRMDKKVQETKDDALTVQRTKL